MIQNDTVYSDEVFGPADFDGVGQVSGCEFDGCRFEGCVLIDASFASCRFTECLFESCDLTAMKLKNSFFSDVTIQNSKAIGIKWEMCRAPLGVVFQESNLAASTFYSLDLRHLKVTGCEAKEMDFSEANLKQADFSGSNLEGTVFDGADLEGADFSSAVNYTIDPMKSNLKNARFSLPEAVSLLKGLPIKLV